jgi:hypothetical protein
MALPAGVTTASVILKAPVAFDGTPGKVYLELKPNVRVVHAESGTTLADWMTTLKADENGTISILLPHTDQTGFLDESGAPVVNWSYTANIRYDLSGQVVSTAPKVFALISSVSELDLATLPVGAPIDWEVGVFGVVTSVNGETGAVTFTKDDFGLSNVDNTSDLNKPISTATQTALDGKMPAATTVVNTVNTRSGAVTLTKSDVGLANVDNTSDLNKPISTAVQTALDGKANAGAAGVTSVNTRTGAVTLTKSDVGLANVDNTSDLNKPISTATQTALDGKANVGEGGAVTSVNAQTGAVVLTKSSLSLGNVDNTSDLNKPISTAVQSAIDTLTGTTTTSLNLKADKARLPLNVKDYGAVGDGTANDTAAIQAALDAVPTGGRAVYFPAGRYKITSTLLVKIDGTTLYGDGPANRAGATQDAVGTRIEAASGITGAMILVQRAANDRPLQGVNIHDLTLDGGLFGTAVNGITYRVNQGHIDRVHIWNCSGDGLHIMGYASPAWDTYDTTISNSLVGRCVGNGVVLGTDTADLHFSHCIFLDNADNMVNTGGASCQVTGCHFYSPNARNIFFNGSGSRSKFANCKIEGSGEHQVLIDSTNGGYSDIQFTGCGFASIATTSATNTWDFIHIVGPTANGISRTTIVGNNFSLKGGGTIKARYAINISGTVGQTTTILANSFGPASHWGTAPLNNASNSTSLTVVRGNSGLGDIKGWNVPTASTTLALSDADRVVEMNSASPVSVTIPAMATVPWVKGQMLEVVQLGAGQVTFVPDTGVTLRTPRSLTTRAQYSTVRLRMRATNEWVLDGDLT